MQPVVQRVVSCIRGFKDHMTVAHDLQEKDKLVAELESKLTSLEDDLEQMKTTVEENDTELKVRRCHGNAMRGKHTCCYFN